MVAALGFSLIFLGFCVIVQYGSPELAPNRGEFIGIVLTVLGFVAVLYHVSLAVSGKVAW